MVNNLAAITLIAGTVLTYTGFGLFPGRIYTSRNIQEKLNLLAAMPGRWVLSQALVILGGLAAAAGSIFLVTFFKGSRGALPAEIAAAVFILGHILWVWHLGYRITQPQGFVKNEIPGGLFRTYAVLTPLALAGWGLAFWLHGEYQLFGAVILSAALLILGVTLKVKDMLPAIYYLVTLSVALRLLF